MASIQKYTIIPLLLILLSSVRGAELIMRWDFQDGSLRDSISGVELLNHGAKVVPDHCGRPKSAYRLDGYGDYLYALEGNHPLDPIGPHTIVFWARPEDWSTLTPSISFRKIPRGVSSTVQLVGPKVHEIGYSYLDDQFDYSQRIDWFHVALIRGGDEFSVYINGNLTAHDFSPEYLSVRKPLIWIGSSFGHEFVGQISDLRVYKGLLQEAEIDGEYSQGKCVSNPTPKSRFIFFPDISSLWMTKFLIKDDLELEFLSDLIFGPDHVEIFVEALLGWPSECVIFLEEMQGIMLEYFKHTISVLNLVNDPEHDAEGVPTAQDLRAFYSEVFNFFRAVSWMNSEVIGNEDQDSQDYVEESVVQEEEPMTVLTKFGIVTTISFSIILITAWLE